MRKLVLLLLIPALPCTAGQVYRCTGPDGSITFTNIACPAKAAVQQYRSYTPAPDSPLPAPQRPDNISSEPVPSHPAYPVTYNGTEKAPASAAGYQCSAAGRTWVQAEPCPPTSVRHTSAPVNGFNTFNGAPLHGTVAVPVTVEVKQQPLSEDVLCDQLAQRARTAERGKNADSSYERRKMAHAAGCN